MEKIYVGDSVSFKYENPSNIIRNTVGKGFITSSTMNGITRALFKKPFGKFNKTQYVITYVFDVTANVRMVLTEKTLSYWRTFKP